MQTRKPNIIIGVICSVAFIINYVTFYPGFMMPDTLDQYQQAISGNYGDWHPPIMSFFWSLLNNIHKGPAVMLAFQLGCLWGSCYTLLTTFRNKWCYLLVGLLPFLPFVQNFAGAIVKDSQMALTWLLACCLLVKTLAGNMKPGLLLSVITALLLLYGCWVRPNALPGALPLFALWSFAVTARLKKRTVYLYFGVLSIVAIVGAIWLSGPAFNARKQYAVNKLYMHDLAGIFVKTGKPVFPALLYQNDSFDTAYIRTQYHPATFDMAWWNSDNKVVLRNPDDEKTADLKTAWKSAIANNTSLYLQNRYQGFQYFLRLQKRSDEFYYFFPWIHPNDYGFELRGGSLLAGYSKVLESQKNMFYFEPWFWFFLNLLLLAIIPLVRRSNQVNTYIALVSSSLLYLLPSFFIYQVDTDLRYFYWNCIACTLAIIILAIAPFNKRPAIS